VNLDKHDLYAKDPTPLDAPKTMKILFDHPWPFILAHGGFQIQIEETKRALEALGVEVEFLRWWDPAQSGDLIHFFGRPSGIYIDFAHARNMPVVMNELLTGVGSRSSKTLVIQKSMIKIVQKILPRSLWSRMNWDAYSKADRLIALTEWEASLMRRIFGAPVNRTVVIPNGVGPEFLAEANSDRGKYLVCTATITPRKRVLELGQAAIKAGTPLWVIGEPYAKKDQYAERFFDLARQSSGIVRYEGPVRDRERLAQIYREARGFVLLSSMESLSLSALEAAACDCPLLLSDLPWARTVFESNASYCTITDRARCAETLRQFYDQAPSLPIPPEPNSWTQVAQQLRQVYDDVMNTSP
jgi:glycosyltransferase involved in cell wall biosynthesis